MKKSSTLRVIFYVVGLLVLALGIILNTKSGLGVSPIISVSYSISTIWNFNFGNMTFVLYTVFVIVEMILHTIWNRREAAKESAALKPAGKEIASSYPWNGSSAASAESDLYQIHEPVFCVDSRHHHMDLLHSFLFWQEALSAQESERQCL